MGILKDVSKIGSSVEEVGKGLCSCGCLLLLLPLLLLIFLSLLSL